jgi:hypothetical protein
METLHNHIVVKLATFPVGFQYKTKDNNPLQYNKPNPPKILVVYGLFCYKVGLVKKSMIWDGRVFFLFYANFFDL